MSDPKSSRLIRVSDETYQLLLTHKGDQSFDAYLSGLFKPIDSVDQLKDLDLPCLRLGESLTVPIQCDTAQGVDPKKFYEHLKYLRYKKKISMDVRMDKRQISEFEDQPLFIVTRLS